MALQPHKIVPTGHWQRPNSSDLPMRGVMVIDSRLLDVAAAPKGSEIALGLNHPQRFHRSNNDRLHECEGENTAPLTGEKPSKVANRQSKYGQEESYSIFAGIHVGGPGDFARLVHGEHIVSDALGTFSRTVAVLYERQLTNLCFADATACVGEGPEVALNHHHSDAMDSPVALPHAGKAS
ncbi:hypothetical protein DL89DRAFT_95140 [Linderina pennispora]|uniref:Uncharacterized protein n=1 Tax=Linderina pennispora TaxID=61395 RepID=A0A1Y1VWU6_9FUNG|nr:uncharacterized protein DL89DRAFT_95140 [Linderina pennispora]ORX65777.1 hypothetical protein DL89DRAFT_95140 [Linderina pennispora]